jgi:phasin
MQRAFKRWITSTPGAFGAFSAANFRAANKCPQPWTSLRPDALALTTKIRSREANMTENGRASFEIPKDMRSMAEVSFEQARKAFERFISGAQAASDTLSERAATVGAGAKDASAVAFSYAEKNVQASLDCAEALLHAKDLNEMMRLQREYLQTQVRALTEQASEMGQIMGRTAMNATKQKM